MTESVGIIGAGPVGCLTAIALAKRGYSVSLFDYRKDPRRDIQNKASLRSINLAISNRGISSIKSVDAELGYDILQNVLPMKGRMIHHLNGTETSQLYGLHGEAINSIDRSELNQMLLNELDKYVKKGSVKVFFEHKLSKIEFDVSPLIHRCKLMCANEFKVTSVSYDFNVVIGCDGAYSETRNQVQKQIMMDFSQEYINCCYIELYIPPTKYVNKKFGGRFALAPDHLHIWPRDNFMLISLPNMDGSFTSTFFGPWDIVNNLSFSKEAIKDFLMNNFPDAMEILGIDAAVESFYNNPKGKLMCVTCKPYHVPGGKAILLGDAAHSMVPFYGQGLNCGLEDVKVLMELLDEAQNNRSIAFENFSKQRYQDHRSIIELSKKNFKEMSHDVTSTLFLVRKHLDNFLAKLLNEKWLPLYIMVTFREDISYHEVIEIYTKQKTIVNYILAVALSSTVIAGFKIFRKLTKK